MSHRLAASSGRHHFFPSRSFNAALSSIASANSRFSLAFSASRLRSRLASLNLEPTVLALPIVERRVAHAVLAAQLRDRHPGLLLLQDADDLILRVPRPLHPSVPLRSGLYLLLAEFSGSTSRSPHSRKSGRLALQVAPSQVAPFRTVGPARRSGILQ